MSLCCPSTSGPYALVIRASGILTWRPTNAPVKTGWIGNLTLAARNPMANRLKDTPVEAVALPGNFIGA